MSKRHLLFIDPIEKLNPKKDSTLLLAHSMKLKGLEPVLIFEKDFFFQNTGEIKFNGYDFSANLKEGSFYLYDFKLEGKKEIIVGKDDTIHMRLDPPFDTRYLRYLWMLIGIREETGCKVLNRPEGILNFNEKLACFTKENSLKSYVGSSEDGFLSYVEFAKANGVEDLILKPLDLYQGIGVEKVNMSDDLLSKFQQKVKDYAGPVIAQPFDKSVETGEYRTIFFKGQEIGTILKVPPKGSYLANIAQGADFHVTNLNEKQLAACKELSDELAEHGADWLAFDILGDNVSEVNVTCPGLLVEVSEAVGENLCNRIIDLMDQ